MTVLWLYPWWWLWGFGRWLRHADNRLTPAGWWWDDGRHTSWRPVKCSACRWLGPRRWAYHMYSGYTWSEDATPRDECPRCGREV